jgi:hypothetical protein
MTTKKLNRRQVRWAEFMANFDFKIHHCPGSLNGAADALSRRSDLRETERPITHDPIFKKHDDGTLRYNQPQLAKVALVRQQHITSLQEHWRRRAAVFKVDVTDSNHEDWLKDSNHEDWLKDSKEYKEILTATEQRPYVPPPMREDLIWELHESPEFGHPGADEMVRRIAKSFAVPYLRTTVQAVLGDCLACQQNKPKRHKPYGLLQPLPLPARPWTSVTMDFIVKLPKSLEPGLAWLCNTILVIVNQLTKAVKFVLTEELITTEECAYEVKKALFSEHGVPEEFITNRDKLFTLKF